MIPRRIWEVIALKEVLLIDCCIRRESSRTRRLAQAFVNALDPARFHVTVLDPEAEDVITAGDQLQNVDYAPFEGTKVTGRILSVYLGGQKVVENHQVVREGMGQYVVRGAYQWQKVQASD